MKRKKAIRKKNEQLAKLDIEIINKANEMIDWASSERTKQEKDNPFRYLAKAIEYAFEIKVLVTQKQIIKSQPIPPKKLKPEGVKLFNEPSIVGEESTERILNATNSDIKKDSIVYSSELSSDDIAINFNKSRPRIL